VLCGRLDYTYFLEIFTSFEIAKIMNQVDKICLRICGLDPLGTLALVDIATLSCFNHDFLRILIRAPCLFNETYSSRKFFVSFCQKILT
jgi:hypothetical protein